MVTEEQVINAIQSIIQLCDVKESINTLVKLDEAVENGHIDLDSLKSHYGIFSQGCAKTNIQGLFDVIFLKHDNIKTIYLIKGLKVLISEKNIDSLSMVEIEEVRNFHRTIEDNGVKEEFVRVAKETGLYCRYISILKR